MNEYMKLDEALEILNTTPVCVHYPDESSLLGLACNIKKFACRNGHERVYNYKAFNQTFHMYIRDDLD